MLSTILTIILLPVALLAALIMFSVATAIRNLIMAIACWLSAVVVFYVFGFWWALALFFVGCLFVAKFEEDVERW